MHPRSLEILFLLSDLSPRSREQLYHRFGMESYKTTDQAIDELVSLGYTTVTPGDFRHHDYVSISFAGESAVDALCKEEACRREKEAKESRAESIRIQERREDAANEKRKEISERTFQVIMVVVSFLLGLITEHFTSIVKLILHALH